MGDKLYTQDTDPVSKHIEDNGEGELQTEKG